MHQLLRRADGVGVLLIAGGEVLRHRHADGGGGDGRDVAQRVGRVLHRDGGGLGHRLVGLARAAGEHDLRAHRGELDLVDDVDDLWVDLARVHDRSLGVVISTA
jgi:hypothetical protein